MNADTSDKNKAAFDFLKEFLEELISDFKKYKINSRNLLSITKALYITDNFGKVKFDGAVILYSGVSYEGGGSNYYVLTIYADEISFTQQGSDYTPGVGTDSVSSHYYSLGDNVNYIEMRIQLDEWKNAFYEMFDDGDSLTIEDSVENLEEREEEEE